MDASVAVIVATFGSPGWARRAEEHALASLVDLYEQPDAVIAVHGETLARARNGGAAAAETEWLCFLDADDRLDRHYLTHMRAAIRAWDHEANDDVVRCGHRRPITRQANGTWAHDGGGWCSAPITAPGPGDPLFYPSMTLGNGAPFLPAPRRAGGLWQGNWLCIGTLIRRELFLACKGFWEERAWEDWSLWQRAAALGAVPVAVPGAVYHAASSPDGRNASVTQPFALGASIRRANRDWLAARGHMTEEADRWNAAELDRLESLR